MKISECSYCGTLAITDNDVCSSCQLLIAPDVQAAGQNAPPPAPRPFPGSYQSQQPVLDSKSAVRS